MDATQPLPDSGADSSPALPPAAQRVQTALSALGLVLQVREFPQGTRTAQDAAAAVGCAVGQIVKSLIFKAADGAGVLALVSGSNRVDEKKISALLGQAIGKADADFVRAKTGFAIGGVPPLAHAEPLLTLIDEDLLHYDIIWAAAGTPSTVFRLTPAELAQVAPQGRVVALKA